MIKNSQQTIRSCFPQMSVDTSKHKKSTMSEMSQTISYERTNFFFIKSKHAFREYKNHQYFQSRQQKKQTISQLQSTEFVQSPTPFGIDNAYQYMCNEVSKNYLKKKSNYSKPIASQAKQAVKRHRRTINLTLPNLNQLSHPPKILKGQRTDKVLSNQSRSFKQGELPLQSSLESRNLEFQRMQQKPLSREYLITIIYMNKFQSQQRLGNLQIKVNIFPYIMKTFLKAKLNYFEITNAQFLFIVNKIVQVYEVGQSTVSLPDIVNCKYIRQVFQLIQDYAHYPQEQRQIIRHFFVANQEVYNYQFNCIKDQIKYRINLQSNCLNNDEQIFVFEIGGQIISNLYQLIKFNNDRFIVGVDEGAHKLYNAITKQRNSRKEAAQRLKKWKSIVPNQSQSQVSFHQITDQRYQNLFQKVQKKRGVIPYSKKKPNHFIKNPIFIERQKLVKSQSIFQ